MTTIIRRNKPATIIRREKPPVDPYLQGIMDRIPEKQATERFGKNWPGQAGWPPDSMKSKYHLIRVEHYDYPIVFLWDGRRQEWTSGITAWSASVMARNDYIGECTPIYRTSSQPADIPVFLRRKIR